MFSVTDVESKVYKLAKNVQDQSSILATFTILKLVIFQL